MKKKIANENKHLDKRFIFYNSGFNLRPTDITASIGLSQFNDLDLFIKIRSINRKNIVNEINKRLTGKLFQIIKENSDIKPSWFGLPILLSNKINKNKFIKKIEASGIETRPIISGNFLKQPSIKKYKLNKKIKLINSDYINNNGFFIGLPTRVVSKKIITKLVNIFEKSI